MNTNKELIVVLLDRSGSMSSIREDMIGGFNTFIEQQRLDANKMGVDCRVSLYRFDTEYEVVFENMKITESSVQLNKDNFEPRGGTALHDAACRCIDTVGKQLAQLSEDQRPGKVVFIIITDGFENASREFRKQDVVDRVTHQRDHYNWQFVYLGSNQDAWAVGGSYNFNANASYANNAGSVNNVWGGISRAVSTHRISASPKDQISLDSTDYSNSNGTTVCPQNTQ